MSTESLPVKEWIVIFYPQTGAARLCPSVDFAQNIVSSKSAFAQHVYRSPNDFRVRHDHVKLETCWKLLHKSASWQLPKTAIGKLEDYDPEPPDCGTEEFAKRFWEFVQDVGDRLSTPRMAVMGNPKENYQLRVVEMTKLSGDEEAFKNKYNKQARTVFRALLDTGKEFLTEEEIKKAIYRLVAERALKTKQEPWVIFQYYRPQFIKDGYVVRGRKPKTSRKEQEDE
jgi:hypothetical protein